MSLGEHPRHGLDELIHAPVRLSIVAALASAEKVEFRLLRDTIEVSDSLLSKHLRTLDEAGYVHVEKGSVGRRPRTWLSITATGRAALDGHVAALTRIVAGDADGRSAAVRTGEQAVQPPQGGFDSLAVARGKPEKLDGSG
jgi:DNA-binding MarR family transcriptional regulator